MEAPAWAEHPSLRRSSTEPNGYSNVNSSAPPLSATEADRIFPHRKMAIPRLTDGMESAFTSPGRFHRRHSGCRNCREAGIICCYTDGKREKSKRQLAGLEAKIQVYDNIMKKLSIRFGMPEDQLMAFALAAEGTASQDSQLDMCTPDSKARTPSSASHSELALFANSYNNSDYVEEDFNKDEISQATGFIGQSSEISWLQTLSRELDCKSEPTPPSEVRLQLPEIDRGLISALNYYLDDQEMSCPNQLDVFSLPPKDVAAKLYKTYLEWVHPSFPILGTTPFGSQFQAFFSNPSLRPGNKWLAILNLVFALAAKYTYISEADMKLDRNDHFAYFSKARVLSMDDRLFHHTDLQQLQVEGLASLYMLASGHVNRAWKLCGSAIRGALGLGLHLRNMGEFASDASREIRYRVWWSLYMIDHRLTMITGRPSCIDDNVCTTPLPVPFDECDFGTDEAILQLQHSPGSSPSRLEKDASLASDLHARTPTAAPKATDTMAFPSCGSLYFLHLIRLTLIAKKMTTKLYSPTSTPSPWLSIEFAIHGLVTDIERWHLGLPKDYDFTSTQSSQVTQITSHQRMNLALLFYSTKMSITRPCLRQLSTIKHDEKMHNYCKKTAADCVEAACHMLRLFPEDLAAATLYKYSPWWCILHFLMQATTVLLLELAFNMEHAPEKASMIYKAAEKSQKWLRILAKSNMASEKARHLCDMLKHRIENRANMGMHNISHMGATPQNSPEDDAHVLAATGVVVKPPSPDTPPSRMYSDMLPLLDSTGIIHGPPPTYHPQSPGSFSSMETDPESGVPGGYDSGLPYDPSTGQITTSFFPGLDLDLGDFPGEF
ncbi:hypothetical protein BO70DRAFT_393221 [Aspergillus heteromorphus CBS 117.55]|uniref:Xylanolytic transcriptional activator regulatory domain-containing protein n=1 Tax=Aspergillus heteromorphus CBS 117.55 TaxID=1448321 RepID=A0A317WUD0_9EURO|nr:uncharacterized protein BO70DRAFT_393221 [Aspergillus heteromorphus CBS 117.55]PWY90033.1 hypothetical protein BO70DRAFT_393221 [Aspergillus heteromorphus CBS 117.55]